MTRAQPGADATAERLRERGLVALVEPLFALVSLPATPPEDFAALAFTSANGVRAFAALSAARDRPAFCVGDATAAAAKAVGYLDVRSAGGDVDALLALLLAAPATGTIVHAGNEDFAETLWVVSMLRADPPLSCRCFAQRPRPILASSSRRIWPEIRASKAC